VTDLVLVQILDTREYLLEEFASFLLFEPLPLDNIVEELAPSSVFHYQK